MSEKQLIASYVLCFKKGMNVLHSFLLFCIEELVKADLKGLLKMKLISFRSVVCSPYSYFDISIHLPMALHSYTPITSEEVASIITSS